MSRATRAAAWSTSVAAQVLLGVVLLGIVASIASGQGPHGGVSCPPGYTMVVSACSPPGAPAAGRAGTLIDGFDATTTPWGKNLINRWQVPSGTDPWSAPGEGGAVWPSGGGMWEVGTPFGRGFKFVATPEMEVASGGKKSEIADIGNLVQGAGHTETWSGLVMFPKAGNPKGFPRNYPNWNVFFDFHSNYGVPLQMGIDTNDALRRNHIYFQSHPSTGKLRKARSRSRLVYDRWYSWRIQLRWSPGSDGFLRWWLNGRLLADWTGPTLAEGEIPYLQFGFYSVTRLRNEAWHARIGSS